MAPAPAHCIVLMQNNVGHFKRKNVFLGAEKLVRATATIKILKPSLYLLFQSMRSSLDLQSLS